MVFIHDLDKFHIGPFRKYRRGFNDPAHSFHRRRFHVFHKGDKVGIAHGDRRPPDRESFPVRSGKNHRLVHTGFFRPVHGYIRCPDNRLSHVHFRQHHFSLFHCHMDGLDAPQGFQGDGVLPGQSLVIDIFGNAPGSVPAHFPFRSIRIEHPHPEVRLVRRADADESVRPDAKTTAADEFRDFSRIGQHPVHTVHIDVIVAAAMHFGEFHFHGVFPLIFY